MGTLHCPKCNGTDYSQEKRPDGDSVCCHCKYRGKSAEWKASGDNLDEWTKEKLGEFTIEKPDAPISIGIAKVWRETVIRVLKSLPFAQQSLSVASTDQIKFRREDENFDSHFEYVSFIEIGALEEKREALLLACDDIGKLNRELDELRTQLAAAKDEIEEQRTSIEELQRLYDERGDKLTEENVRLNELVERLSGDYEACSNENIKLTEENARLKSEIQLIEGAQKSAIRFNDENKQLTEKLRLAKEDFKRIHYNNYRGIDQSVELRNIAGEALAKLESDK